MKKVDVAKDLGIELNPLQKKAMNALRWYTSVSSTHHKSGRTTAMCLAITEQAIEWPGYSIKVFDHINTPAGRSHVIETVKEMIDKAPDTSLVKTNFFWKFTKDTIVAHPVDVNEMFDAPKPKFKTFFAVEEATPGSEVGVEANIRKAAQEGRIKCAPTRSINAKCRKAALERFREALREVRVAESVFLTDESCLSDFGLKRLRFQMLAKRFKPGVILTNKDMIVDILDRIRSIEDA